MIGYKGQIVQLSPYTLTARVEGYAADNLTAAEVESIEVVVYDETIASQVGDPLTVDPAEAVHALRPWPADKTGYNLSIPIPGSYTPHGEHTYRVTVLITPAASADAEPFYLPPYALTAVSVQ